MNFNLRQLGEAGFAMTANGNAQFIKFDPQADQDDGSGTMEKADTSAYSTARIAGDYAFGAPVLTRQ